MISVLSISGNCKYKWYIPTSILDLMLSIESMHFIVLALKTYLSKSLRTPQNYFRGQKLN